MAEFLDVLDETGKKTGRALPRDEVNSKGIWHLSVNLWVVTPDKKILVHKRSEKKDAFPGFYAQAAAGHVSSGKTSIEAILNETEEEIGLKLKEKDLEFLFSYPATHLEVPANNVHHSFFDVYITKQNLNLDDIKIDPNEVAEAKLVTLKELKEMIATPDLMLPFPFEYQKIIEILKKRFGE